MLAEIKESKECGVRIEWAQALMVELQLLILVQLSPNTQTSHHKQLSKKRAASASLVHTQGYNTVLIILRLNQGMLITRLATSYNLTATKYLKTLHLRRRQQLRPPTCTHQDQWTWQWHNNLKTFSINRVHIRIYWMQWDSTSIMSSRRTLR